MTQKASEPEGSLLVPATATSVDHCYRLLFGREPDAEGRAAWVDRLAREPMDLASLLATFMAAPEFWENREPRALEASRAEPVAPAVRHIHRRPPLGWRLGRGLIARSREHAFLDRGWIGPLLRLTPSALRKPLALRLLGLSPHYWVYQWTSRYAADLGRTSVLEAEFERNARSRREIFEKVLRPFLRPGQTVLDFGCGPGFLAREAASCVERVVAVDVSRGVIACARALNAAPRLSYRVNGRASLDGVVDSESIDLVYSFAVFQHLLREQTERFLGEFARVLRPGGVGLFHTILRREGERQYTGEPNDGPWIERDVHLRMVYLSAAEIDELLRRQGLDDVRIEPVARVAGSPLDDDIGREHLVRFLRPAMSPAVQRPPATEAPQPDLVHPPALLRANLEARSPMRWIKAPLRAGWRKTAWVRRPVARKLDAFLARAAARAVEPSLVEIREARRGLDAIAQGLARLDRLGPIEQHLAANRRVSEHLSTESNLLMDGLLREVTRLQLQVEELRDRLDESARRPSGGLGLVVPSPGDPEAIAG